MENFREEWPFGVVPLSSVHKRMVVNVDVNSSSPYGKLTRRDQKMGPVPLGSSPSSCHDTVGDSLVHFGDRDLERVKLSTGPFGYTPINVISWEGEHRVGYLFFDGHPARVPNGRWTFTALLAHLIDNELERDLKVGPYHRLVMSAFEEVFLPMADTRDIMFRLERGGLFDIEDECFSWKLHLCMMSLSSSGRVMSPDEFEDILDLAEHGVDISGHLVVSMRLPTLEFCHYVSDIVNDLKLGKCVSGCDESSDSSRRWYGRPRRGWHAREDYLAAIRYVQGRRGPRLENLRCEFLARILSSV